MKINIQKYCFLLFLFVYTSNALANKRLIIKYKVTQQQKNLVTSGQITKMQLQTQMMQPFSNGRISQIAKLSGLPVKELNQISNGAHVIELSGNLDDIELQRVIQKISTDPNIEYVEQDKLLKQMSTPLSNPAQWDMLKQGDNFSGFWSNWSALYPSISAGSGTLIAVLDSGYTPHSNFLSQLYNWASMASCISTNGANKQCYGYQFISDCRIAGSCPSSTPSSQASISYAPDGLDLGDYLTTSQVQASNGFFDSDCISENSSWHGTHINGIIAGNGYHGGYGVLGGAYGANIFPVRVLGKCGGYSSDIANSILWLANKATSSTDNLPVKVINMSLGGVGTCPATMQQAINSAVSAGIVVVVAAGNATQSSNGDINLYNVANINPANCENVISVSAKDYNNSLSWYSSYGDTTITASGGGSFINQPSCYYALGANSQVCSTFWGASTAYEYSTNNSNYIEYQGTSQATPHVSALIANLITYFNQIGMPYSNSSLIDILQSSASKLTNTSNLNNVAIGQGGSVPNRTLNAENAFAYAQTNYSAQIVSANPSSLTYNSSNSQVVTFYNTGITPTPILTAVLSNNSDVNLVISEDTCSNTSLAIGASCSLTLSLTNVGVTQAALELRSGNKVISLVPININNQPQESSVSSGGGCSAVQNGDDASLLLILFAIASIYYLKRKNKHN